MAINKNHEFEELDGVKCSIVEKNVTPIRLQFLKSILEFNKFTVIAVPTPAPKAAAKPAATAEGVVDTTLPPEPTPPDTFTLGVTDYTFNTTNALYGRILKTPNGKFVTVAYWYQKESISNDDVPYYNFKD
jgi:hypothetical protein